MSKSAKSVYTAAILPAALMILMAASPAAAQDTPAAARGELALKPAIVTSAAAKSMMLGSAKAGRRIVAVGEHGIVLLSDDDGKSFRQARSVPVRTTLSAVCFADDKNGWAVGQWGVILNSSDGGESWQLQRSEPAVDQPLFSVHFKDRNSGWAVGLWSLLLETRDGGKSWIRLKLPVPPGGGKSDRNLLAIFAGRGGVLYIAAEQGTIIRSADDGKTWTYSTTGYKGSFWSGTALKDGTLLVGGLRGSVFRSGDDGRSWKEIASGVKSSLTSFVENGAKVYGAGLDGVYIESADAGLTFKPFQREDRAPITSLAVSGAGQVVAFSKNGLLKGLVDRK